MSRDMPRILVYTIVEMSLNTLKNKINKIIMSSYKDTGESFLLSRLFSDFICSYRNARTMTQLYASGGVMFSRPVFEGYQYYQTFACIFCIGITGTPYGQQELNLLHLGVLVLQHTGLLRP
jgi:hypothetical protein